MTRFRRSPVWSNSQFVRLFSAATVSAFGTDISHIAFPFVAILTLDASPWDIGILRIATIAPAFFSSIIAGAWVDRVRRRPLMIAADWFRAVVILTIPLTAWLGHLTFVHLLVAAALLSVASTLFDIADRSFLPSVVERDELTDANRMLTAGSTAAETSGFALGGWLVQIFSAPGALVIDAGTFIWSALTLRGVRDPIKPENEDTAIEPMSQGVFSGLRMIRNHRTLLALALSVLILSTATQIIGTVYLLYVNQEVGFHPGALGVIFATGGLFSLIASLTGDRVLARFGLGPVLIGSLILLAGGQSLIALVTTASAVAVILMVLQQATDYPWTLYEIFQVTIRQSVTPNAWQGRVHGSFHLIEFGGYLLGAVIGGWMGSSVGLRWALVLGGILTATAALPLLTSPVRRLRTIPLAEAGSPPDLPALPG